MKKVLLLILLFSLGKQSFAQTENNIAINWLSFEQLSDSLETNPKKVLIFFHTDWCSYCKKMMNEAFENETIITKINQDYYAVQFDAESVDTVIFDNVVLSNSGVRKKTGQYHQIATLLTQQSKPIFPTTILFNADFTPIDRKQKYLSIKDLLKFL